MDAEFITVGGSELVGWVIPSEGQILFVKPTGWFTRKSSYGTQVAISAELVGPDDLEVATKARDGLVVAKKGDSVGINCPPTMYTAIKAIGLVVRLTYRGKRIKDGKQLHIWEVALRKGDQLSDSYPPPTSGFDGGPLDENGVYVHKAKELSNRGKQVPELAGANGSDIPF
jgi:hypothetical protein